MDLLTLTCRPRSRSRSPSPPTPSRRSRTRRPRPRPYTSRTWTFHTRLQTSRCSWRRPLSWNSSSSRAPPGRRVRNWNGSWRIPSSRWWKRSCMRAVYPTSFLPTPSGSLSFFVFLSVRWSVHVLFADLCVSVSCLSGLSVFASSNSLSVFLPLVSKFLYEGRLPNFIFTHAIRSVTIFVSLSGGYRGFFYFSCLLSLLSRCVCS